MSQKTDVIKEPTEMEAAVLGAIWQKGPCTAYSIRKEFLESVSPRWSGSAGAIYPLLQRLEQIGFVESKVNNRGKRNQRDYVISSKGLTVFRRWLRNLHPENDTKLIHDPLRSKMFFFGCNHQEAGFTIRGISANRTSRPCRVVRSGL